MSDEFLIHGGAPFLAFQGTLKKKHSVAEYIILIFY